MLDSMRAPEHLKDNTLDHLKVHLTRHILVLIILKHMQNYGQVQELTMDPILDTMKGSLTKHMRKHMKACLLDTI